MTDTNTRKLTDEQVKEIIEKAQREALIAAIDYLTRIGGDNYPCGFAWVNIKPARGQFVKVLKEMKLGRTDEYYGGYTIWNPSTYPCQNVDAKEAGARVFAEELRKYGVKISVKTRWD